MATFIQDTIGLIDGAIASFAQNVFEGVGGSVMPVIIGAGAIGMSALAVNSVMQLRMMSMGTAITWSVRYVMILAVATSWAQFVPIFNILTQVPQSYGGAILTAAGVSGGENGLYAAMDQMTTTIFQFSDAANERSSAFSLNLLGFFLTVMGALMSAVAIIVAAFASLGLATAVGFAPLMIAMLMFNFSSQIFESWVRFTLGFAMIPMVLAGVMGTVIAVAQGVVSTSPIFTDFAGAAGFIIIIFAAIFMMRQIPTLTSSLAGTIVASASSSSVSGGAAAIAGTGSSVSNAVRQGRATAQAGGGLVDVARSAALGAQASSFERRGAAQDAIRRSLPSPQRPSAPDSGESSGRLAAVQASQASGGQGQRDAIVRQSRV